MSARIKLSCLLVIVVVLIASSSVVFADAPDISEERCTSYVVRIESQLGEDGEGVAQGQPVDLQIVADNLGNDGISGFDLTIQIDATALVLLSIEPGDLPDECDWEYFTYQYGNNYIPIYGVYRILAIADIHNGRSRPTCVEPEDGYPVSLANLEFLVTNDQSFAGLFAPVRFAWFECTSNTLSSGKSPVDVLYERRVFDDTLEITDHDAGLPSYLGTPDSCLPVVHNEHRHVHKTRRVDFYNGGIQIAEAEPFGFIGDINANGVPFEIGDAVVFTNYFVQGLSAFGSHVDYSIMASDVNENGQTLELADLQTLCRVVIGDPEPYPGPVSWTARLSADENTGGLLLDSPGDIQALSVVVAGEYFPQPAQVENTLDYAFDGSNTRLLFLGDSVDEDMENSPLAGPVLVSAGNHDPQILSAEAVTYYGQVVRVEIGPAQQELAPYNVRIELEDGDGEGALQGQFTEVSVFLDSLDTNEGLGGFDFLFTYDPVALQFYQAVSGQLYDDCGWEYFSFRMGADADCVDCPADLARVVGVAETNNGPYHPTCDVDTVPANLFDLVFLLTNDRTYECQYVPVRFFWADCGDNSVTNREGTRLFINDSIYDLAAEDDISDGQAGLPGYFGAPDECLTQPISNLSLPERDINFRNGGVQIICAGIIDPTGDINLNGVACEIADVVMFWNYFEHGLSAFGTHIDGSIAASDVNENDTPLELADFFYLNAIVIGDAPPSEPVIPTTWHMQVWTDDGSQTVRFTALGDIAGLLMVIEGDFTPTWTNEINNQYIRYFDGTNTRLLFVGSEFEIGGTTDVLTGDAIFGFSGAEPEILYVEAVTHYGQPVSLELGVPLDADDEDDLLPTDFALKQNYPNPFNPETQIAYSLPEPSFVTLEIYNMMGQRVRTLHEGTKAAGEHMVLWDGTDDSGARVASGIYLYRLTAGTETATRKMLLLK